MYICNYIDDDDDWWLMIDDWWLMVDDWWLMIDDDDDDHPDNLILHRKLVNPWPQVMW